MYSTDIYFLFQFCFNETVEVFAFGFCERLVGPVDLIFSSLGDPFLDQLFFFFVEFFMKIRFFYLFLSLFLVLPALGQDSSIFINEDQAYQFELPNDWFVVEAEFQGVILKLLTQDEDATANIPGKGKGFSIINVHNIDEFDIELESDSPAQVILQYFNDNSTNDFGDVEGIELADSDQV